MDLHAVKARFDGINSSAAVVAHEALNVGRGHGSKWGRVLSGGLSQTANEVGLGSGAPDGLDNLGVGNATAS